MPVYETFSKRQEKLLQQGKEDIYQYDELPMKFRVQVDYILRDALGYGTTQSEDTWKFIHETIAREFGINKLSNNANTWSGYCFDFLRIGNTVRVLDLIEFCFKVINKYIRDEITGIRRQDHRISQEPDEAISELNIRFKENGIGYRFESGELIRVDSQFIHSEVVKPAIALLSEEGFDGPLDEFFRAYEHFRKGDNEEAITLAENAFESTIKTICDRKSWNYNPTDAAKGLIETVIKEHLIPTELQETLVQSSPRLRNKFGGHGQGAQPRNVPDYLAAFALHHTASNIVYLVNAYRAIK